jgi:hypothetical protein
MKNKDSKTQPSLRDVMDRYSPIVGGRTGIVGEALKLVSRLVELLPKVRPVTSVMPMPEIIFSNRNAAGQTVWTSNIMLASTFGRMEKLLQRSFDKASKPGASINDRQKFVTLAEQVQQDAAVLASQCTITNPKGAAKYEFVLQPNPGQHIPLSKAFAAVQKDYRGDVDHQVEIIRLGTERPVIMMRPVKGFKKASRRQPTA